MILSFITAAIVGYLGIIWNGHASWQDSLIKFTLIALALTHLAVGLGVVPGWFRG